MHSPGGKGTLIPPMSWKRARLIVELLSGSAGTLICRDEGELNRLAQASIRGGRFGLAWRWPSARPAQDWLA